MGNKEVRPFGMRDKIGYGLGDFGCNMSFAFINNYLMVFYVTCMGIKAKHFAVIILLAKIFDAINDPIIGGICDASKPGKDGKFKPWIKWASLPLLVSSILMFIYAPNAPYALKIAMCLGLYCVWSVAYTSVNVPYGSMQSVITTQSDERSSLSTWRSVGAMLAQIPVMVLLPKLVYDSKTSNPRGNVFIYIVGVMGLIGFVSFILLRKLTTERVEPTVNNVQKFNYFKTLASFFKNKPMMGVTISSVAYLALMMTVTNSMQYVFMCYFKNTKIIPIATVIAGLPIGLGIVITKPLLKKFTKKQLCTYPFAISAVAAGIATFVRFDNPYVWIAFIGISMFGTCFYLTLMWALVADCIDYQEEKTGRREEGSIYATYSLFRKIAQGVGASIIALSLDLTGYSEKLDALSQAEGVPEKIYTMTGALPLIGALICLFSMHFLYNIKDKKSEE
ncbi:MAG: MFS transporter [Eubacterium coprostanoligenes]|uniref:MFS transporter n=1 Tax=Eubacterium coprostanoligenes TaxID=290054 RepID=UPI0024092C4A|nr:MFS transporter [Eubacterium coprostanoligenes]MDD6665000.1 MFS transporter [Eubacterium coprostanoligenes]